MNLNKMVQKINPGYGAAFNYWHYEGGLTTPTCNEVANFIIAEHPLIVTDAQVSSRKIIFSQKMRSNFIFTFFFSDAEILGIA